MQTKVFQLLIFSILAFSATLLNAACDPDIGMTSTSDSYFYVYDNSGTEVSKHTGWWKAAESATRVAATTGEPAQVKQNFTLTVTLTKCEVTESPTVALSWSRPLTRTDGSVMELSELGGYRAYMGLEPGSLTMFAEVDPSETVNHVVNGLNPGQYFFAVTAYDTGGLESSFSEVVTASLQ